MVTNTPKRSVMALYSSTNDPYSHRVRIVLAEKGVTVDIVNVDASHKAIEELAAYNPYGSVPTLVDRDLVLYKSEIIMEYLDERFPHPPLMPVYPVAKGRTRLMIHRVNQDWYSLMDKILSESEDPKSVEKARKDLTASLTSITPVFAEMPYFISEEFSLIDCCIAPLLWRLPLLGVKLPHQAQAILAYADRIFQRESFQASLTDNERLMRK
ncbi:MAG TPA: glutathione S-transferase N-terminal domain-containing protein [Gammaproteobacteria bacterium]|nr:glutathione S-transferase N-terminal domain-containing protein [Gammaproteobacteria bacterium]